MKHAIVTGANGFIGSALIHTLEANGIAVTAVVRNQQSDLSRIMDIRGLNIVYCAMDELNRLPGLIDKRADVFYHLAWEGSTGLERANYQMQLKNATNITNEIYRAACQLFDELWDGTPIRHLCVHTSRVCHAQAVRQMNLFDETDYCKWEEMDRTIDRIRAVQGNDIVRRAVFGAGRNRRIDHMSGGVSRERRDVDYSKLEIV